MYKKKKKHKCTFSPYIFIPKVKPISSYLVIAEKTTAVRTLSLWKGINSLSICVLIYSFIICVLVEIVSKGHNVGDGCFASGLFSIMHLCCLVTFDCLLVLVWVCVCLWFPMWSMCSPVKDSEICLALF